MDEEAIAAGVEQVGVAYRAQVTYRLGKYPAHVMWRALGMCDLSQHLAVGFFRVGFT